MGKIISTFIGMWLHPWTSVRKVKEEGGEVGIKSAMLFIVIMGLISGLVTAIMGMIVPPAAAAGALPGAVTWLAVVVVPLVSFVGSFVGAFFLWGLIFGLLKGTGPDYKSTYRLLALLAAFSPISALLSPVPAIGVYIGIGINLWATFVMIRGVIIVMDTKPVRTWVVCLLVFGTLFLLGITARFAAQRSLAGGPGLPTLGDAAGFGLDDDALNQELQALADQAKQEK